MVFFLRDLDDILFDILWEVLRLIWHFCHIPFILKKIQKLFILMIDEFRDFWYRFVVLFVVAVVYRIIEFVQSIRRGLSETNLNKLCEGTYNETEAAVISAIGDISTCEICREDFKVGHAIIQLPCKHIFCKNCIFTWLKANNTCPCCRDDVKGHFT